jgi:hypothetical protein
MSEWDCCNARPDPGTPVFGPRGLLVGHPLLFLRRQKAAAYFGEMRVQGQHIANTLRPDEFQAYTVHQAQQPTRAPRYPEKRSTAVSGSQMAVMIARDLGASRWVRILPAHCQR